MSKAIVAKVTQVFEIPGATNIHVAKVLGESCIVSKDVAVGFVGILFPSDTQLSEEYCYENNLFRDKMSNKNPEKSGFFESTRRVRVQPFLKVKSTAYFTSLESVSYVGNYNECSALGYTFDSVNGKTICNKYISEATRQAVSKQNRPKQAKLNETPYFEKHVDSAQFKHSVAMIPVGALIHFHAKVHGTSARMSHTLKNIELPKWKKLLNKFAPKMFPTTQWAFVTGSRNVVLRENATGFHGSEQYRFDVTNSLKAHMPKGVTIFGEIAGYVNGKPIMAVHQSAGTKDKAFQKKYGKDVVYKYGCKEHEYRFHIYRITSLTQDGVNIDWTEAQIEQFCAERGLLAPLNVHPPVVYDGDVEKLCELVERLTERTELIGEDYIDGSHPGEGIILRIDTGSKNPYFLKSKAYFFRNMEGLCEAVDTEDVEAA